MDEGPRFFTLEEANGLVSTLEIEFGRIAAVRSQLGPLIVALGGPDEAVQVLQGGAPPPAGKEGDTEALRRLAGEITAAVERVNGLGCLVKDVELGLVDFYALMDDEPVFLCWQFGEPVIGHWHGVDEGFAARRALEDAEPPTPSFPN